MSIRRVLSLGLLAPLMALPSLATAQDDPQLAEIRSATDKFKQVETVLFRN